MAFLTAFGLGGEKILAHSQASPSGASPKPSAAKNRAAREKYGLEAIENKTLQNQPTSSSPVLAKRCVLVAPACSIFADSAHSVNRTPALIRTPLHSPLAKQPSPAPQFHTLGPETPAIFQAASRPAPARSAPSVAPAFRR